MTLVQLVTQVRQGLLQPEILVIPVIQVTQEIPAIQGIQAILETLALQVYQVLLVIRETLARQEKNIGQELLPP